jgi:hypothetical protein
MMGAMLEIRLTAGAALGGFLGGAPGPEGKPRLDLQHDFIKSRVQLNESFQVVKSCRSPLDEMKASHRLHQRRTETSCLPLIVPLSRG